MASIPPESKMCIYRSYNIICTLPPRPIDFLIVILSSASLHSF
jgi:hypothetical protein